jgi:chorismate mutase
MDAQLAAARIREALEKSTSARPIVVGKEALRALLAERDELAKDAARYRWLRNEAWGGGMAKRKFPHVVEYRPGLMPTAVLELAEEALDDAIDAALTNKD